MYGMDWVVKIPMLALMTLGSVHPISAFAPPPIAHSHDIRRRAFGVFVQQDQLCTPLSVQPPSRAECGLQQCTSSATASSDAAREEDPWPVELSTEPFSTSYPDQQRTATSSAASGEREAFMFTAKPLPEGTTLRRMEQSDVDGVVGLYVSLAWRWTTTAVLIYYDYKYIRRTAVYQYSHQNIRVVYTMFVICIIYSSIANQMVWNHFLPAYHPYGSFFFF